MPLSICLVEFTIYCPYLFLLYSASLDDIPDFFLFPVLWCFFPQTQILATLEFEGHLSKRRHVHRCFRCGKVMISPSVFF